MMPGALPPDPRRCAELFACGALSPAARFRLRRAFACGVLLIAARFWQAESSSARFAEAATEAARVGMLDETGQASKEAEAKHAAEVAVKTEW